jgi:predicted nuclease of restriction endonuclease-like (RecB) superfamily
MSQVDSNLVNEIAAILKAAQTKAFTLVNRAMIDAYWQIGYRIVEEEQRGAKKAQYKGFLLKQLAEKLTQKLDKQLDERELRKMRQFYLLFPIRDALRPELTWTHYRALIRVDDERARSYYLNEAADQGWGTRQLERNIQSCYYARTLTQKTPAESVSRRAQVPLTHEDVLKDPYVLEFLGLNLPADFSENDLESAILSKIQQFLLEMGKGFAFVARQCQIKTETKEFYIDLVLYNYLLKCFVLVDLKITELSHQDIGQMDMYVRMWEDLRKLPGDNPTIGIILCTEKDATLVKYSVLDENKQLFASSYRLVLPSEEELTRHIELTKHYNRN